MKKIPYIPKIPEELISILHTGQLILFIGAGASRLLGYPSWEELADKILCYLAKAKKARKISFADIESIRSLKPRQKISIAADICELNKIDLLDILKTTMVPKKSLDSDIYQLLVDIPTNFITTNYDSCLTDVLPQGAVDKGDEQDLSGLQKDQALNKYFRREDLTVDKLVRPGNVFHLHGSLDLKSSLVLTTRDYINHYRHDSIQDFLNGLFEDYHVLFIGYGLEEEEILEYVIRKKQKSLDIEHFRLFPAYSHQKQLVGHLQEYYQNQCGVKLIPYCIDKCEYNQLEAVLAKWLPELRSKIRPLGFTKTVKNILDRVIDENGS